MITIAMIPFTLLAMVPTNDALFGFEKSIQLTGGKSPPTLEIVQSVVRKWAIMHFVRSMFPLGGALVGTYGLLGEI